MPTNENKIISSIKRDGGQCCRFFIASILLISISFSDIQVSDPLFNDNAVCDYLIIAPNDSGILHQIDRLANAKWEKGLQVRTVTLDSIYTNFTGQDSPEKIRNCIKQAYHKWGIIWVLLVGDFNLLPARTLFANTAYPAKTDIYYSCLDGNYESKESNGYNAFYEEIKFDLNCRTDIDSFIICQDLLQDTNKLDFWPNVYIGRLPVKNVSDCKIIVEKILDYANNPTRTQYAERIAFLMHEMSMPHRNELSTSTVWAEEIGSVLNDPNSRLQGITIDRFYEDSVMPSGSIRLDSIRRSVEEYNALLGRGYDLICWAGHGTPRNIEISRIAPFAYYRISDIISLKSSGYSNMMMISCSLLKTERDTCIAKSFLFNPHSGTVSFVGATQEEYANNRADQYKFTTRYLGKYGVKRLAKAIQLSSVHVKDTRSNNHFVQQYWGDPEMELKLCRILPSDTFSFSFRHVSDKWVVDTQPGLDSTLVCLYKKGEVFLRGYTQSGKVKFNSLSPGIENITVTATHHGFLPTSRKINGLEFGQNILPTEYLAGNLGKIVPGHKIIKAKFNRPYPDSDVWLAIYDIGGREILNLPQIKSEGISIDMVGYGSGIYLAKIRTGDKTQILKFSLLR